MSRTLLLNASYEPLTVLSVRRAVNLVLEDKVTVLEERDSLFRAATLQMFEPAVLLRKTFVHVPYQARIPLNRRAVVVRDKGVCQYCHAPGDTIDHIVPRARGGVHRWENVVCACRKCNGLKGDKTLEELGWTLKITPYAPAGTHWLVLGFGALDPLWAEYLNLGTTEAVA